MTYEDPRSGRERNLGQDDVQSSTGSWIAGLLVVAAIALGGWYYFNHTQRVADVNHPATTAAETGTSQSSGPGVQGAPGSTNGPAVRPDSGSSTGASTGTSGSNPNIDKTTPPSQDATGVKGAEGGTNGPASDAPKK